MFFFLQAEDGIRDIGVTGVQTCALPIFIAASRWCSAHRAASSGASPAACATAPRASGCSGPSGWTSRSPGGGGPGQVRAPARDRKSVVEGKRVDLGGRRIIKKNIDRLST